MNSKNTHNESLELVRSIDLSNDKKLALITQSLFLLIAMLGAGIIYFLGLPQGSEVRIVYIILSCVTYIIMHELIHIVFMLLFSKEKILVHFKLPYLAVGSNYYFNKRQFIIIALAPFILFLAILSVTLCACPSGMVFLLSVLMVLNVAGTSGDFVQVFIIAKLDKSILIQDDSKNTKVWLRR